MVFFGAAGALVVVLLVVAGAVLLDHGSGDVAAGSPSPGSAPAGSGVTPESYSSSPSARAYAAIDRRSADPTALTMDELFSGTAAAIKGSGGGPRLALREKRLDNDCVAAVWGNALGTELRRAGCTQVARGLYADVRRGAGGRRADPSAGTDRSPAGGSPGAANRSPAGSGRAPGAGDGHIVNVAIFNLADVGASDRLVEALGTGRGGGFVKPLTSEPPLDRVGRGFSMARGLAMGHYAVVAWAERLDGEGDPTDAGLLSLLIEGGKAPAVLGRAARPR